MTVSQECEECGQVLEAQSKKSLGGKVSAHQRWEHKEDPGSTGFEENPDLARKHAMGGAGSDEKTVDPSSGVSDWVKEIVDDDSEVSR